MTSLLRFALLATAALYADPAFAASCTTAAPNYPSKGGRFGTIDGTLYAPDGKPFVARGINVLEGQLASIAGSIDKLFPGINFIRIPVYKNNGAYADPSKFTAAVQTLTGKGIVIEFEDHSTSVGGNAGGGHGVVFTGQMLADELAWDSAMAKAYANNPYVWLGTNNEPPLAPSAAALSTWQGQQYDAIRKTGNNNPILIEINGWADPASFASGYTPAVYSKMSNVIADVHIYPWLFNYSTNQAFVDQQMKGHVCANSSDVADRRRENAHPRWRIWPRQR